MYVKTYPKLISFSSIFGGGGGGIAHNGGGAVTPIAPVSAPQQLAGQPSGAPAAVVPGVAPGGDPTAKPDPANSHLEALTSFWQTPTTADGKPSTPTVDPLREQMFNFDPAKIGTSVNQLDFTSGLQPEVVTKALSGDAEAFKEAMNTVVRQAFAGMTLNTGKLLNDGFSRFGANIDQALPTRLKAHEINNSVSDDPVLSHAGVAPLLHAMKVVASNNNPNAKPAEIQAAAEKYIKDLFGAMSATQQTQAAQAPGAAKETDWLDYSGLNKS